MEATAIARRLATAPVRLYTSNMIVAETHALALGRRGRKDAAQMLARIDAGNADIVRVTETDERRAREIIRQYADKDFSLTNALSFAVIERLHIPIAFTFDSDFEQFGVAVLRAEDG